jgi:lipopolysaccharide transport system permease protein
MIQDLVTIWKFRYFWLSLVKMDLMTRYRKSVLGVLWSLLNPLGMTLIFCVVFTRLNAAAWDSYAKFLIAGIAAFAFLRDCAVGGCQSLIRHEGYIRQAPLPFAVYSLRVMLSNAVHFLITLGVVVVLVAVLPPARLDEHGKPTQGWVNPRAQAMGEAPPATDSPPTPPAGLVESVTNGDWGVFGRLWMVLPAVVLAMVCGWALATITGFATVYFHDISHLLELFAQFFFFITPVMWYQHAVVPPGYEWLVDFNPASAFIDLFRLPLVYAQTPDLATYCYATMVTAVAVGVAAAMVNKLSKRVIFQL